MKKTLMCATAAAAFASAGLTAHAEGWYGRTDLQYTFDGKLDHDPRVTNTNGSIGGDSDASELVGLGFGLGYAFDNGLRLETALGRRTGDLDVSTAINGTLPGTTANPAGYASVTDLMLNGIYDFNKEGVIRPYIGVGVGGARVDAKVSNRVTGTSPNLNAANGFNSKSTNLAYQGLLGVGFALSDRLTMDVGYKYFATDNLGFDGNHGGTKYDAEYSDHTATLGLRYAFGVTPPPPPPPPPPPVETTETVQQQCSALSQEFVVYFEWDRSDLTSQAAAVIDQAVANITAATGCAPGSVAIVGHTDTSGGSAYNEALSVRRADVVAAALTERGIGASIINKAGKGETALAKATNDGVREPLNRRSEVTIVVQ